MHAMTDLAPATRAQDALLSLRPQTIGAGNPTRIVDPLIEPLWAGLRALAAIEDGVAIVDEGGAPIEDHPLVAAELAEAALASSLILDGVLSKLTAREPGVYVSMDDLPSASQLASRPLLGVRRTRAEAVSKALEEAQAARTFGPDDVVTFVAFDLLWLDGESLIDVPLLERRRLLDSVLGESERVRRGAFVRAPAEAFIGSWRSQGFTGLTYRSANGRYHPGQATEDWISMPMPRR
jgi:hypothetical protein